MPHAFRPDALTVVGKTTDGKIVVQFFTLVDSCGVSLDLAVETMHENDLMPDWTGFMREAVRHGWHPERTRNRLEQVVESVYGQEFLVEWRKRMDLFMGIRR